MYEHRVGSCHEQFHKVSVSVHIDKFCHFIGIYSFSFLFKSFFFRWENLWTGYSYFSISWSWFLQNVLFASLLSYYSQAPVFVSAVVKAFFRSCEIILGFLKATLCFFWSALWMNLPRQVDMAVLTVIFEYPALAHYFP